MIESNRQKLLLIAPLFFGYYKEMILEAQLLGYEVDYICDAPSDSNISKAIGRINKSLIKSTTKKYFEEKVVPAIQGKKYDYVLVVGGMTFAFTPDMIGKIKNMNPNAIFVLYQWDSERNLPYSTEIHKFFERIFSFDLDDCNRKKIYTFLPLFYTKRYEEIGKNILKNYDYDCAYVGTAHPKKYKDINIMVAALKGIMPKQFIYHYMPSKLKFIYHKIFNTEFRTAKLKEFEREKISSSEIMRVYERSKCILDAPQAGQKGLTIRTIECLGAKRKLITTNADVKKYDFYNENNILVFDGTIDENNNFFKNSYEEIDETIYKKYSLQEWIKFMLKENNYENISDRS